MQKHQHVPLYNFHSRLGYLWTVFRQDMGTDMIRRQSRHVARHQAIRSGPHYVQQSAPRGQTRPVIDLEPLLEALITCST